jgi:hypothetical protein
VTLVVGAALVTTTAIGYAKPSDSSSVDIWSQVPDPLIGPSSGAASSSGTIGSSSGGLAPTWAAAVASGCAPFQPAFLSSACTQFQRTFLAATPTFTPQVAAVSVEPGGASPPISLQAQSADGRILTYTINGLNTGIGMPVAR